LTQHTPSLGPIPPIPPRYSGDGLCKPTGIGISLGGRNRWFVFVLLGTRLIGYICLCMLETICSELAIILLKYSGFLSDRGGIWEWGDFLTDSLQLCIYARGFQLFVFFCLDKDIPTYFLFYIFSPQLWDVPRYREDWLPSACGSHCAHHDAHFRGGHPAGLLVELQPQVHHALPGVSSPRK